MDPVLALLINVLSLVFWGGLLVMFLRHVSRSEKLFKKVEEAQGKDKTSLQAAIETLEADRDRLRARLEAVEAIVTSESYDLEREARAAGIAPPLDLDALEAAPVTPSNSPRHRVR